jgi:hypothetical protein
MLASLNAAAGANENRGSNYPKLIFDTSNLQAPDHNHESALEKRRGTTLG